jgi:FkbM family methyltransferase
VGIKRRIFRAVQSLSTRLGYPMIAKWRLSKWDESTHLRQLFAMLDIDCVLDVGANVGQYHDFLRLHPGYSGRIVSFEPVAEMYEGLKRATAKDPLWSVHKLALGDAESSAEINVFAERTLSSLLARNEENLRVMGYDKYLRETELDRKEVVPVRRLDNILDSILPPGASRIFLKSDTQGYDMAVIRGASGCLHRILGIQIELPIREVYRGAPGYLEGLAELTRLGYEVTGFVPVQRDATLRVINVDCIMIRHDEAERLRQQHRHAPGHEGRP